MPELNDWQANEETEAKNERSELYWQRVERFGEQSMNDVDKYRHFQAAAGFFGMCRHIKQVDELLAWLLKSFEIAGMEQIDRDNAEQLLRDAAQARIDEVIATE